MLGHLAEDPTFNAFGDSRPALDLGLDGMDTRPIQLLGLDDMEPHFVNEALNLAYDDGHQSVGPLSLDSAFDLGFAPFKKSASLDALDIVHNDVLNGGIDEEDSNLLNCLQLEVPFLSQSGFNIPTRREAGPRANTARGIQMHFVLDCLLIKVRFVLWRRKCTSQKNTCVHSICSSL